MKYIRKNVSKVYLQHGKHDHANVMQFFLCMPIPIVMMAKSLKLQYYVQREWV